MHSMLLRFHTRQIISRLWVPMPAHMLSHTPLLCGSRVFHILLNSAEVLVRKVDILQPAEVAAPALNTSHDVSQLWRQSQRMRDGKLDNTLGMQS